MFKYLEMILGNLILSIAVSIIRYVGMGTDPLVTLNSGLSNIIPHSFGTVSLLTNIFFVINIFNINKKLIKVGTMFNMIMLGYLQDYFISIYTFTLTNYWSKLLLLGFGIVLYCISIALIINADEGISPYEGFVIVMAQKFNLSFAKIKIGSDLLLLIVGFILGAVVYMGTFIIALFTGPIISLIVNKLFEIENKLLEINKN